MESKKNERQSIEDNLKCYKELYEFRTNKNAETINELNKKMSEIYKKAHDNNKTLSEEEIKALKNYENEKDKISNKQKQKEQNEERLKSLQGELKGKFMNPNEWAKRIGSAINFGLEKYLFNQITDATRDYRTAYESNFTSIAGRTGYADRQQTHALVTGVIEEINNNSNLKGGLNLNHDVMPEIVNATKQGFLGEEAQEVAISNAIDKKIMPWLDTSSDTWINMRYELSDEMLQSIKGQQLLLQETREGNRILQDGVANLLLESMQPTLMNIDSNTTSFEDLTGQAQGIYSYYRQFMSKQDAMQITNKAIDIYQNPGKALLNSNSTVADKLQDMVSVNGGDIYDIISKYASLYSMGSNTNSIGRNAIANAIGLNTGNWTRTGSTFEKAGDADAIREYMQKFLPDKDTQKAYSDKIDNLTEYVTATQEYDNNLENAVVNGIKNAVNVAHLMDVIENSEKSLVNITKQLVLLMTEIGLLKLTDGIGDKIKSNINIDAFKQAFKSSVSKGMAASQASGTGLKMAEGSRGLGFKNGGLVGGLTQGGANLTGGLASGAGATAIGTAGVIGGAAFIGKGASTLMDVGNYEGSVASYDDSAKGSQDAVNIGTGAAMIGGGIGLTGAALGLLSGPVGWIGLGVAGLGLLVKSVYDSANALSGTAAQIEQKGNDFAKNIDDENTERMRSARLLKENVDSAKTTYEKQNLIIQEGLLSESEARKLSADEINNLTQTYATSSSEIKTASKDLVNAINRDITKNVDKTSKDLYKEMYDKILSDSNVNDQNSIDKGIDIITGEKITRADQVSADIYKAIELLVSGTDDKDIQKKWNEAMEDNVLSYSEAQSFVHKGFGTDLYDVNVDTEAYKDVQAYTSFGQDAKIYDYNEEYVKAISDINSAYIMYKNSSGDIKTTYENDLKTIYNKWRGDDGFVDYVRNVSASSKLKLNTIAALLGLEQYRLGSPYIPYDMFALLHSGERVLTAEQNKDFTENVQSNSGSIIVNSIQDVISAIENQTKTIIDYLSTAGFNGSETGFQKLITVPSMGNTKVTW